MPVGDIAFFLIFSFTLVTRQEMIVVVLVVMMIFGLGVTFIHQVHPLFEILISLGKPLDDRREGLYLPLQGIGGVSSL